MPLKSGTRLGRYEIVASVGAGGMGEVFRARDTQLDRTVVVKVLPSHVAATLELRERFERKARAVAALNHPHICTIHDVGNASSAFWVPRSRFGFRVQIRGSRNVEHEPGSWNQEPGTGG